MVTSMSCMVGDMGIKSICVSTYPEHVGVGCPGVQVSRCPSDMGVWVSGWVSR